MVKVNDTVRFLNDVGGGRVTRIEGKTVYVEDEDGFERPVQERDVVVVGSGANAASYERPITTKARLVEPDKPAPRPAAPAAPSPPVEETPEGENLNLVLAYAPKAIKHLNTTTFYTYLVNDSNYFLYFTYMTRGDLDDQWQTRYHGIVEPNIQVELEEFGHDDLNDMTHIAVQYIAFKQDKGFKLKTPALVEQRLDVTKFYKLHCFHESPYFEESVISIPLVRDDRPTRQMVIDSGELERAMKTKRQADKDYRPAPKPPRKKEEIIVKDLHINELLDNTAGLSPADMLNYQMDKFREVMTEHERHKGQRIVFIHGKGEGVLRKAILDELKRRWPHCEAQDASFREYGFGATQITIH